MNKLLHTQLHYHEFGFYWSFITNSSIFRPSVRLCDWSGWTESWVSIGSELMYYYSLWLMSANAVKENVACMWLMSANVACMWRFAYNSKLHQSGARGDLQGCCAVFFFSYFCFVVLLIFWLSSQILVRWFSSLLFGQCHLFAWTNSLIQHSQKGLRI